MKRLYIDIEQRHIDQGKMDSPSSCPIQAALTEKYDGLWLVWFESISVRPFGDNFRRQGFDTSRQCEKWQRIAAGVSDAEPCRLFLGLVEKEFMDMLDRMEELK